MARFLFAPMPFTGHVNPGLPIARELVERGHDVRWYSTPRFRKAIDEIGARYVPYYEAMRLDEARLGEMFPKRPGEGISQLRFDISKIFVEFVAGALRDVEHELAHEPADVIVGDNAAAMGGLIHERSGIPWAVYGIAPLTLPSLDTAPFGLGLLPKPGRLGELRNRILYWLVDNVIFAKANRQYAMLRKELGLPPVSTSLFDFARHSDLYLQGSVPSFEYPRRDMPSQLHFVGASIPRPPAEWKPPGWWSEMSGRRVILVTQGTINNDFDQLIRPAIRALAAEDALVVVTTGSRPPQDVAIEPLPANVRVERFVPYAHLMPHVDVLVTNGGYGSIQIALAHGVPVVAMGKTEEKPDIANRVQWSGVGVGVKVRIPTEKQIGDAVAEVLGKESYRSRAKALQQEMRDLDAAKTGADLLENLAGARRLQRIA